MWYSRIVVAGQWSREFWRNRREYEKYLNRNRNRRKTIIIRRYNNRFYDWYIMAYDRIIIKVVMDNDLRRNDTNVWQRLAKRIRLTIFLFFFFFLIIKYRGTAVDDEYRRSRAHYVVVCRSCTRFEFGGTVV